jgi:hypothetical protein
MSDQQVIPAPNEPTSGPCDWCGTSTHERLVLDRGWTVAANGQRVPKLTKWAWACPAHLKSLVRREGVEA